MSRNLNRTILLCTLCIAEWPKKAKSKAVRLNAKTLYGGEEVGFHAFLTWALDGGLWPDSRAGSFIPKEIVPVPLQWEAL